jgi:hypothetical protein
MAEQGTHELATLMDLTLIDEALAMTVEERLRQNDRMVRASEELRESLANARRRSDEPAK